MKRDRSCLIMSILYSRNTNMMANILRLMYQWKSVKALLTIWEDLVLLLVTMVSSKTSNTLYITNYLICLF